MLLPTDTDLRHIADQIGQKMCLKGLYIVTAESCTGGWIAKTITDLPGASAWFDTGFVVYSDRAKHALLGIDPSVLANHGAVSAQAAKALTAGALARSPADIAVGVTGIAGPSGGSEKKPVGTVWISWQKRDCAPTAVCFHFDGNRNAVRCQSVAAAFDGVLRIIDSSC